MGPVKVILNPVAGRGYGAKVEPQVRRLLEVEGLDFELVRTARPWHAAELATQAADNGYQVVVAAGGDGTSNEVLNGLMATSGRSTIPTMGVIPVGSGSDFANTVGIPSDLQSACRRLANGRTRMMDVCRVTVDDQPSRYFGNVVGIGFDGFVNVESRKIKRLRGVAQYLPAVLKTVFLYYKAPLVTIEFNGQEMILPALMICVANGPREGGGFFIAPQAQPDDGLFDLCIAREVSRLAILGLIPHFMKGTHVNREPITMARARQVTVSSSDHLVAHMDGEILCTDAHKIACEILPRQLQIRC